MLRIGFTLLAIVLVMPLQAQASKDSRSASAFVARFYTWYTPIALNNHGDPAFGIALKRRKDCFTPELCQALQDDFDAQLKANAVIVGLDGDPFLQSQDPEAHHKIGKVTPKGDGFLVSVHGVRSGKPFKKPAVIPEVRLLNGRWVFVNFHSSDGWNILDMLRTLKEKRQMAAQ